jgi:hypothetical protein
MRSMTIEAALMAYREELRDIISRACRGRYTP